MFVTFGAILLLFVGWALVTPYIEALQKEVPRFIGELFDSARQASGLSEAGFNILVFAIAGLLLIALGLLLVKIDPPPSSEEKSDE
jgi:hypothetical protein